MRVLGVFKCHSPRQSAHSPMQLLNIVVPISMMVALVQANANALPSSWFFDHIAKQKREIQENTRTILAPDAEAHYIDKRHLAKEQVQKREAQEIAAQQKRLLRRKAHLQARGLI